MPRLKPQPLATRPRVSVVIPCYNYGRFLGAAVGSALDQSGVDVEVLVVDDCSTDDSAVVAQRLAAEDPRVDVVVHETNRGHIRTYNDGLARATGDYVVLLSADDLLTRDSLTRSVALLENRPEVGFVYGLVERFTASLPVPSRQDVRSWTVWPGREWVERTCRRGRNIIGNPEVVMRRSLLEELGGYDPRHPHAADLLLWMRAAARADVGRVNGPVQAGYRVHNTNMHATTFEGVLTDVQHIRRTFEAFFEEHPDPVLERMGLRALAREAMEAVTVQQTRGEGPGGLVSFAQSCDPGVVSALRWRGQRRRSLRGTSRFEATLLLASDSWRWRLRSQRARRWGI